jgi:hypothetical protein
MRVTPLHKLAQWIREGRRIDDNDLLETLGRDGTITVPMHGGGERLLPSGEILSVLCDGTGVSIEECLKRNFGMDRAEIDSASAFIRLVQFAGDEPAAADQDSPEQPFQPLDR